LNIVFGRRTYCHVCHEDGGSVFFETLASTYQTT
jgi:hypothetical protein